MFQPLFHYSDDYNVQAREAKTMTLHLDLPEAHALGPSASEVG